MRRASRALVGASLSFQLDDGAAASMSRARAVSIRPGLGQRGFSQNMGMPRARSSAPGPRRSVATDGQRVRIRDRGVHRGRKAPADLQATSRPGVVHPPPAAPRPAGWPAVAHITPMRPAPSNATFTVWPPTPGRRIRHARRLHPRRPYDARTDGPRLRISSSIRRSWWLPRRGLLGRVREDRGLSSLPGAGRCWTRWPRRVTPARSWAAGLPG